MSNLYIIEETETEQNKSMVYAVVSVHGTVSIRRVFTNKLTNDETDSPYSDLTFDQLRELTRQLESN